MRTVYDLLRVRCGLSQQEAAEFHDVRLDTIKSWSAGRNEANPRVLAELRGLYQKIIHASGQLGARIDALKGDPSSTTEVTLGTAESETAARKLGFPCMGAHAAALGLAIATLGDDVAVALVPYRQGIETANAKDAPASPTRGGFQSQVTTQPRRG
jgi:hypothetical protein